MGGRPQQRDVAALAFPRAFPTLLFKLLKQFRALREAKPMCSRPLQFHSAEPITHRFGQSRTLRRSLAEELCAQDHGQTQRARGTKVSSR